MGNKNSSFAFIACAILLLPLCGCIQNDIPLPYQPASFTAVEAEGALAVDIDDVTRTVTLEMDEVCDLSAVKITGVAFNYPNTVSSVPLQGTFDLRTPLSFTLRTYQDYDWKICATQDIERWFSVQGQIGETVIDPATRRIYLKVSKSTPLTRVTLKSLKLGPREISVHSLDVGTLYDLSGPLKVFVSWRDVREEWTIYAEQSDLSVELSDVSPRARNCYLRADAPAERHNGFRWRAAGSEEWIEAEEIETAGGSFIACIEGLEPLSTYECLAYSDEEETGIQEFTTGAETQVPNAGFEEFSHAESQSYYSWYGEGASKWWDSGNIGSTMAGAANAISIPDTEDFREGKASAMLVSRYVIVKFAAGNIFSGSFGQLQGTTGATVNFGRPFTDRPRAVRVWIKYICGTVDCFGGAPEGDPIHLGAPDNGQIYVALGDWDYRIYGGLPESPVCINTSDKSTFFKPDAPAVIAYGAHVMDASTQGWVEVEFPLAYRDNFRLPTHIIISAASSRLGDYFTGSSESRMWIDDFRLIY
ncbi:MAG: PCMD domain-containing protein [Bacteroidales bacterium]|nr:PCMD domain-containing protein [Bacteroidales bacterium]